MAKGKNGVLHGIAFNDADYNVKKTENGKIIWTCPYYLVWQCMINRCFSEKYKQKFTTYKEVTCCDEWLYFSKFKAWMETQDWQGKVLDKDLKVIGNSTYGPENCLFIDDKLNGYLSFRSKNRGDYPIGVSFRQEERAKYSKPFVACISVKGSGNKTLGYRATPKEAHMLWLDAKIKGFDNFLCGDEDIDSAIFRWKIHLNNHLENNIVFKL